jgi:hypothetical protein
MLIEAEVSTSGPPLPSRKGRGRKEKLKKL